MKRIYIIIFSLFGLFLPTLAQIVQREVAPEIDYSRTPRQYYIGQITIDGVKNYDDRLLIGLSGLITPSLEEMVNVARELQRAHLNIPIMIGGATTSELHVALKIAPVYEGPVVWLKDASQNALVAARLLSEEQQVEQELSEKYEHLREEYRQEQDNLQSLEEARKQKLNLFEN